MTSHFYKFKPALVSHMTQIVFSVPVGLPPDEVVPNIMAAINMLVFQTGSNVMWYLGMESRGRARFLVQTRAAERIMAEVRKHPAWLVGLSVLIVECGEDVVTLTSKPGNRRNSKTIIRQQRDSLFPFRNSA